jgi:DNA-binding transcriptional ArsR family regulator
MPLSTDEVLTAVEKVRTRDGVCSLRSLATELGVSHTGARYWVQKLQSAGLVEANDQGGSIRLVGQADHGEITELLGTVTLGITYSPSAQRPLRIEVVEVSGALGEAEVIPPQPAAGP